MRAVRRLLIGVICVICGPDELSAQSAFDIKAIDPDSFRAIAFKVSDGQQPAIDGKLTDEAWSLAPVQGNFVQREPDYGQSSSEKTEFRVLYDDKKLFLGVWVWDSDAAGILASEMKRDAGLNKGDQIKITIDTFHDHRNAFYRRAPDRERQLHRHSDQAERAGQVECRRAGAQQRQRHLRLQPTNSTSVRSTRTLASTSTRRWVTSRASTFAPAS